jgi:hypothetical protein
MRPARLERATSGSGGQRYAAWNVFRCRFVADSRIVIDSFKRAPSRRSEVQHTAENSKGKPVIGRPFMTGDRRINRRGRPRNFDAFRELCQKICHERVTVDGAVMTRLEVILRDWAGSKDAQKQIALIQYGYGKPVDKIGTNLAPTTTLRLYYAHEFDKKLGNTGVVARSLPYSAVNGEGTLRPLLPDAD